MDNKLVGLLGAVAGLATHPMKTAKAAICIYQNLRRVIGAVEVSNTYPRS